MPWCQFSRHTVILNDSFSLDKKSVITVCSCGKVMFSQASVILSTGWGHVWQGGVCVAGGHAWQEACVAGGGLRATADTTGYGQWAGGTHPTGMHSCYNLNPNECGYTGFQFVDFWNIFISKLRIIVFLSTTLWKNDCINNRKGHALKMVLLPNKTSYINEFLPANIWWC